MYNFRFWRLPVRRSSKSLNAIPERESECVDVKTVSPTHLRLTATTTKSAFCALHGLHEISIKLTRRRHVQKRSFFVSFNLLNA